MVEFLIVSVLAVLYLAALLWGPTAAPRSVTRPRTTANKSVSSPARDSYTHQEVFP
jgi:hypothetical protein